jgi:hypothetical protein
MCSVVSKKLDKNLLNGRNYRQICAMDWTTDNDSIWVKDKQTLLPYSFRCSLMLARETPVSLFADPVTDEHIAMLHVGLHVWCVFLQQLGAFEGKKDTIKKPLHVHVMFAHAAEQVY